jgi:hypothetical protein
MPEVVATPGRRGCQPVTCVPSTPEAAQQKLTFKWYSLHSYETIGEKSACASLKVHSLLLKKRIWGRDVLMETQNTLRCLTRQESTWLGGGQSANKCISLIVQLSAGKSSLGVKNCWVVDIQGSKMSAKCKFKATHKGTIYLCIKLLFIPPT